MQIKKCPECSIANDELATFCTKCNTELTGISVIEKEPISSIDMTVNISPEPPHSSSCNRETIRYEKPRAIIVADWDSQLSFEIKDGTTIGRSGKINVTAWDSYTGVSALHAIFIQRGQQWFIRDENSTNGTLVNEKALLEGQELALYDGYKIVLGSTVPEPLIFTFSKR